MGFFRFRRSIKILPGVRWNIGKKSSSLSFGGSGAHYTVGSNGSRTTVGIPGTGLSYTEFHGAHRRVASRHPRIPEPSEAWLRTNTVDKTLHIPDRRPDEPPIRPDQLDRFRELEHVNLKGIDLHTLGCDQADALLHQIQIQQKEVSKTLLKRFYADHGHAIPDSFIDHCYDHPDKPWKQPNKKGHGCLILIGIFLLIGWFNSVTHKEDHGTSSPATATRPVPPPQSSPYQPPATHDSASFHDTANQAVPIPEPAASSQTASTSFQVAAAHDSKSLATSSSQSSNSRLPAPNFWPKEVRISAPVVLSGTVDGGTIRQTAKPGAVLDATLSPDQGSVILRRLDISGTLPIGDTDFMERARKAETEK